MLSGYSITEILHETSSTIVYRGCRDSDQLPVVVKLLKVQYPTLREITRFRHEYNVLQSLQVAGVVQAYELLNYNNGLALVLEDFGGRSLKSITSNNSLSLTEVLAIAIQIADTLAALHHHPIIHKDIKPHNIIYNPDSKQTKLIDFSIASLLLRENQKLSPPEGLEGTLSYMSPEQTGRMNRGIDYRTDLYSLGVTLYELLTGQLPFQSDDPLELVHSHIAKVPPPPDEVAPHIPPMVSAIVMKLLAKTAESRYQSAYGLKADLEYCLQQLETTGTVTPFVIGQQDQQGQFHIPEKLYGREAEVNRLLTAFDRVCTGKTELLLVAGYSGIGKSALVNEVHKPIVQQRGYFIAGKYDPFKRNVPYSGLVQAFQELIQQLLTESEDQIAIWRGQLIAALGINAQVIVEVIPEVERIIGQQPPVPQLGVTEAQNRFNLVFRQFIQVFATPEHPLVIFLDDLQWADAASLHLIQLLTTTSDAQCLLLIGAYRNNEVNATHPLMLTLEAIQTTHAVVQTIVLKNLTTDQANQLIADTLHCSPEAVHELTHLILTKTQGNPFFLTQLLKTLHQDDLLVFHPQKRCWQWDMEQIQQRSLSDNVVEFLINKLQKLPPNTQAALKLAACIGSRFDLHTLATVAAKPIRQVAQDLWIAIQNELITPVGDTYKIGLAYEQTSLGEAIANQLTIVYRFLHDRIQQAAYGLVPELEKRKTHLAIGRLLLQNTTSETLDEKLFDIVNAFNLGIELITSQIEKNELTKLNLIAGQKAKASAAYEASVKYFMTGIELLGEIGWQRHYELMLTLHSAAAEAAYTATNYDQAEELVDIITQQALNQFDQAKAYEIKMQLHMAQLEMRSAIDAGLKALEMLYIPLWITQADRIPLPELSALDTIPEMTDPQQLTVLRLLRVVSCPAYQAQPDVFRAAVLTAIQLCLQHGHSDEAAYAYAAYGWFVSGRLEDPELAYHSGQIALALLERLNAKAMKCAIYQLFESFIRPWKEHLRATFAPFREAIQVGQEMGAIEHASYCLMNYCTHLFLSGEPLEEVDHKQAQSIHLLAELKQEFQTCYTQLLRQLTLNLRQPESLKDRLVGESFDENWMLPRLQSANNYQSLFAAYTAKLILAYLFGNFAEAVQYAKGAARYADSGAGLALSGAYCFYHTLALLANFATSGQPSSILEQAIAYREKLQLWATHAPMNYQHKLDLVIAEIARLQGQTLEAMEAYDRAIQGAKEQQYLQEEAIANERAAAFYLAMGKAKIAQVYLADAHNAYTRWGAVAKAIALEQQYPQLLQQFAYKSTSISSTHQSTAKSTHSSTGGYPNLLDLNTVIKASQALSSEIILDNLLTKLMQVVIENAGAQRGVFIVKRDDQWRIEAEIWADHHHPDPNHPNSNHADQSNTVALRSTSLSTYQQIPQLMINYVIHTQENLVIDDGSKEEKFITDPYIAAYSPKSILCFPILYQGKFKSILYLENNLITSAFTPERMEILKLLMSQAAISIENALLYTDLQTYSQELEIKSGELEFKNEALQLSESQLREKTQQLESSLQKLKQTHAQLVQTEKISSLGQMVAGVAHEVNNPLSFIAGNLKYAQEYFQDLVDLLALYQEHLPHPPDEIQDRIEEVELDYLLEDLPQILTSMTTGTDRIREIMSSLRTFSRIDTDHKQPVNIHEGLDSTLLILRHRLKANPERPAIELVKQYGDIPRIECYPGQLNQVFMNLIANAIDALEEKTEQHTYAEMENNPNIITIRTEVKEGYGVITIADNGLGIPEEAQKRLFEAFFTTKSVGKGTGLGLSISYQIVTEKHGGRLTCHSTLGQGTKFVIEIPIASPPAATPQ